LKHFHGIDSRDNPRDIILIFAKTTNPCAHTGGDTEGDLNPWWCMGWQPGS